MAKRTFDSLEGVFVDVAKRKRDAASQRFRARPTSVESPRDVYLQACAQTAAEFVADGFKYAKTGPHLSKRSPDFLFRVSFQSSHNNVAGLHVVLWMHANVSSPTLMKWRTEQPHPYRKDGYVAGGMVHLLEQKHPMIEWELADPTDRNETVQDAVSFIRSSVLPYFAQFENPKNVIEKLRTSKINAFDVASSVEFTLCFGAKADAQAVVTRFLGERPDLRNAVEESLARLRERGFPSLFLTCYADQIAWVRLAYGLA